jgi:uncharacterized tellurite resistance protein B-like protein
MLKRVRAWLAGVEGEAAAHAARDEKELERRKAAAALLVEAARLDGHYGPEERARIREVLAQRFGLERAEAEALAEAGESAQSAAVDLHRFTRSVLEQSEAERLGLIEMLWEVVYADGVEHPYESSLMRRVTGLLHVSDQQSGAARQRVLEQLRRSRPKGPGKTPGA